MSFHPAVKPLMQPVRPAMVLHHLGQLALILAVLFSVPLAFAAATFDWELARRILLAAVLPALALGAFALIRPNDRPLQANEALVITALTFIIAAALMTYPLTAEGLSPLDAWFESVSGVTTTGLSLVPSPELHSDAFLFTRAWMQWFGGLGIVVLSLALAFGRSEDMRRLADAGADEDSLPQGTRIHARRAFTIYVLLTVAGLILVLPTDLSPFEAVIHTLAAISTGGFGSVSDSLAGFGRSAQFALFGVSLLGALPLFLYYRVWRSGPVVLLLDPELRALIVAVALVTGLLWWLGGLSPADALLQAGSAQTTTGFSTLDSSELNPAAKGVLILSMATGGAAGSTAGGIKLLRLLILIRMIQLAVMRVQLPRHAVVQPAIAGRTLDGLQIEHALVLILLFLLLVLGSWMAFLVAGYPALDALFEVVSATATVGLSAGVTSPDLEPWLKLLLSLNMLAGRLEIIALLVLLFPGTWYKP
ncbi:TrkH family potassium uptake protein [Thiocapsa bogorovii]|uniref:TrkH family potassium uptake protein n=1 Tax=Thiocapsa bogorovii TaxID=521689 RepID=UPI001E63C982|nr:potassium transporter TrkG [Thiocapsa bogorovii]UHD17360.1 TrkH family potassium uptake protein [Thiocapsa bogorovii]